MSVAASQSSPGASLPPVADLAGFLADFKAVSSELIVQLDRIGRELEATRLAMSGRPMPAAAGKVDDRELMRRARMTAARAEKVHGERFENFAICPLCGKRRNGEQRNLIRHLKNVHAGELRLMPAAEFEIRRNP